MKDTKLEKSSLMDRLKKNYFVQAWLILLLATGFGLILAGVQMALAPAIAANKLNETRSRVPELILGEQAMAKTGSPISLDVKQQRVQISTGHGKKSYTVFRAFEKGKTKGWVARAKGQGYADKIELLIGLDPMADKLTGLYILDQKETPGLGNKVGEAVWRNQFAGRGTSLPLKAVKGHGKRPDEIDAVTGATISSRSVCAIVNTAVHNLKKPLALLAKGKK